MAGTADRLYSPIGWEAQSRGECDAGGGEQLLASMNIVNVGKSYGSLTVIHGVTVEIPDGEFVVLVGPSGCGKSTLLRMVAGLEPITFGDIQIDGKVVNDLPPKDRDIAMVFQSYALYPHKTVAENMGFALKMRGEAKANIDSRVRTAAEILDLTPYLARYPASFPWPAPACGYGASDCSRSQSFSLR